VAPGVDPLKADHGRLAAITARPGCHRDRGSSPIRARLIGLTNRLSDLAGHPFTFLLALSLVLVWAAAGPLLRFSAEWITAIQVASGIVTILMVFALQNAQNRHTTAMQLKLNELLRAVEGARERGFADLEAKDDREQAEVREALFEECRSCGSLEEHRSRHAPGSARQAG
jgi:low affinity Fe/Cu permease